MLYERSVKNRNAAKGASFAWDIWSSLAWTISLGSGEQNCYSILDQFFLIWPCYLQTVKCISMLQIGQNKMYSYI